MAKDPTYPTLYDEVLQINISKLKEWDYLKPGEINKGSLTWSRDGSVIGFIGIEVNTASERPYLELDYTCGGARVNYRIKLVSVPSNLGLGRVWYFLCPVTGRRCRKLYSVGEIFLHRQAFRNCMYETQRRSHKERKLAKRADKVYAVNEAYEQMLAKHYKSHYAEKPTKRHLKLLRQIAEGKDISLKELFSQIIASAHKAD